jgi:small GTP-binding protein
MTDGVKNNNGYIRECKVILVGQSGVGKTCISNRFIKGSFNLEETPTLAASYLEKTILLQESEKPIKFSIWDTAGQEKYRSLGKIFYKDANVAILVYDVTDIKSFKDIQKYWYEEIKTSAPENTNK